MQRRNGAFTCLYCQGEVTGTRKGEHIVPEAIGGVRTIKNVCRTCNNGILSTLDRELCSRTPLAAIASQELPWRSLSIGLSWDVDHSAANLLLEAQANWVRRNMLLWPQLVLEGEQFQLRGDAEEMVLMGRERFEKTVLKYARGAFLKYRATGKGLFFEKVPSSNDLLSAYRYPPRVFSRNRLRDICDDTKFVVGYASNTDKRRLLCALDRLDAGMKFKQSGILLGSHMPVCARSYDGVLILRGLTKLGINLLSDTCRQTSLRDSGFREAIAFVRGQRQPSRNLFRSCGFVWPEDLQAIHRHDNGHAFRLLFEPGLWKVYFSFFGGRAGAVIEFPGISQEKWHTADISTPLVSQVLDVSQEWSVTHYALLLPIHSHVEWQDPSRIAPSLGLLNVRSNTVIERTRCGSLS